jgi:phosphotransferase system HPr-like phosphotransfer protein
MLDIDFIEYDKISIHSDAFITSAELNCYFQYIPSTKAISYNIKKELHTAGTTEDPDDYKIPDVSSKILPRKLYRINPFHTNYSENLELNKVNTDPDIIYPTQIKERKEKIIDYSSLGLNSDQIEFMQALQSLKSFKTDDSIKQLNIEQFESVDERVMNGFFQLYPRFMEMLSTGVSTGSFNQFFEDTETSESNNENQALINENIKRLGFNPGEVTVKKKFEVRPGNALKNEVNAYLQDISLTNNESNKSFSVSNNSTTNLNQINLQNNNKIDLQVRSSKTVNNISTANNTDFNFINNTNRTVNQQITNLSKFSEATKIDFENLYKSFLKDLNITPNIENQFFKIINQHSKNLSIEFNRILNHSEKTVYETNLKNLSTSYNFYRHIENRYREFIQNLNFFNDTVQQIKQTEINLKNTYQNIHRHSVTHKNNHFKNIVNLTKNINYEYTANDYEFQYAVLKTIKNSNQYVENKITKIKNDLNVAQQNISFVHHRMVHIQEKTNNYVAKEIKNVLNNTEYIDEYSNIIVNKISNISNNQTVRALLSLVTNEEQLRNIYTVLKQSNINTSNIKNLVDVLNYSKNNNLEITKVSSSTVENIKNLVNVSKNVVSFDNTENQILNKLSSLNITQELKSFVNLSESKSFTRIAQSYKNISNVIENLNTTSINPKLSSIRVDQKNVENFNQIINKSNFGFVVEKLSNFNTENITEKINLLKNINVTQDIKKTENLVRKVTRLARYNNVNQVTENLENLITQENNISTTEFKTEIQNLKNLINVSKSIDISKIDNVKISQISLISENIEKLSKINQVNNLTEEHIEVVKKISQLENVTQKKINQVENIINLTNKTDLSNVKLSSINQITEIIQKVSNFENKDLLNIVNLTKTVQERKIYNRISNLIKNVEVLDTVNVTQETAQNISKISNTNNINQITKDLNLISQNYREFKTSVQQINKISQVKNVDQIVKNLNFINNVIQENNVVNRVSKIDQKDFITAINLSKNYIQSFNRFESKISNISQRQKIRETLQDINVTNNVQNNSVLQVTNKTQKVQLQEFIHNLNLLETEKNTTILNRYSFESNKKNISNLFSELNVTQQIKQEKRTEREFARISKRLDKMNRETIKVQGNSYKVEQNFFDMMSFYNEQKVTKTSKDRKVSNFIQLLDVLNIQKTTNERKVTQKIQKIEQTQNRIVNNTSQIKIDVYKEKKNNYYKVDNRQTFTTNNYHQEKEEQKKTEKIVENKVEELLVKKIENVTNNLVSNVITKNEFHTIKKEIIQEIYNIEMKTEERIKELRKETQQTVQTMLEKFLRS